jgi:hypothetical protein
MLKIENLAVSKDLGRAEMSAIVGGSDFINAGSNTNLMGGASLYGSQSNSAAVTQVDASSHQKIDMTSVNNSLYALGSLVGGIQQK